MAYNNGRRLAMTPKAYNFHLPLSPELHEMLRAESKASGEPATNLAREALADWLRRRKKERRHAEIAAFAREYGGTEFDLDRDLEEAGIEALEAAG